MSITRAQADGGARPDGPRVLIVGGGVMGLSLALMLERKGLDYRLLEARDDITPQVGAGVTFFANAARILDQLGLLDDFMQPSMPVIGISDWWPNGVRNSTNGDFGDAVEAASGYPAFALDRQQAMQIFYREIRDKSKILTSKRVTAIEESEAGVRVTVNGDEEFTGDMLVGADGVHSTVRRAMWRMGEEREPGCFQGDQEDEIRCNFTALFGISELNGEVLVGAHNTVGEAQSVALIANRDRGYYLMYHMLPRELRGADIPQFTAEQRESLAEKHAGDVLQGSFTFGDLYKKRVRSVLVPLQKYAFKRWHFGRIICLGDTMHKMHPVLGQGAAQCLEDAAVFVNQLTAQLEKTPRPTAGDITHVFAEVNRVRQPRAARLVAESWLAGSMHCWKNAAMKFFYMHVVPRLGMDLAVQQYLATARGAPRLEGVVASRRDRGYVGFDDDHPAPARGRRVRYALQAAALLALLAYAAAPLLGPRTAAFLGPRTAAFLGPAGGLAPPALAGPLTVMLVEGWRASNKLSLLQWPLLWAALGDGTAAGWATAAPLFYAATLAALLCRGRLQFTAPFAPVSLAASKAIFPATFLCYILPTVLQTLPRPSPAAGAWGLPSATGTVLAVGAMALLGTEREASFYGAKYARYVELGYYTTFTALALVHLQGLDAAAAAASPAALAAAALARAGPELVWLAAVVSEVCYFHGLYAGLPLALAALAVGCVVVGPGALAVAVWIWRESFVSPAQPRRGAAVAKT